MTSEYRSGRELSIGILHVGVRREDEAVTKHQNQRNLELCLSFFKMFIPGTPQKHLYLHKNKRNGRNKTCKGILETSKKRFQAQTQNTFWNDFYSKCYAVWHLKMHTYRTGEQSCMVVWVTLPIQYWDFIIIPTLFTSTIHRTLYYIRIRILGSCLFSHLFLLIYMPTEQAIE